MKTSTFSQNISPDSYLEPHYVGVLQLLQQGDLSDGGAGHSLVLRLQSDLLHGHDLSGLGVSPWKFKLKTTPNPSFSPTFEDNPVGSLSDLLYFYEVLKFVSRGAGTHRGNQQS